MDELNELELEEEETEELEGEEWNIELATVAAVGGTGVKLTIDGDEEAGDKYYKVNAGQLFAVGDRVKIHKNSGTYVVEFVVGSPMSRYPIPSGGSDGQVLMKDGANNYAVKWGSVSSHGIPSGGSSGQFLSKVNATDYNVQWSDAPHDLPSGGSDGQVLTKNGSTNYSVKWANVPHELPSGGTNGQVLLKDGSTNYSVKWGNAPAVSALTSGSYTVTYNGSALYPSNTSTALGHSSYYFNGCYLKGSMRFGDSSYNPNAIGFFGTTPHSKVTTITTSSSLANVIQALKDYGLL